MSEALWQFIGPIEAWSHRFDIPVETLQLRLKEAGVVEYRLPHETMTRTAYQEFDVRRACADLIDSHALTVPGVAELPKAVELMTEG